MLSLVAKQKYYRYIFLAKYVLLFRYILTLIEWERICVFFYCLFISALPWRSSYQKGGVIPLIGLSGGHQFYQHQHPPQFIENKKKLDHDMWGFKSSLWLVRRAHKCGGVNPINGITPPF
jgi:hypothetical protein